MKAATRLKLRSIAANVGLALTSLTLAVLVGEMAIRLVAPQQLILVRPDLWEPADVTGWRHRANVNTRINTGERTVDVYTDGAGFRVGAAGPGREGPKVLILGDSFMEALQVDYEASAAGILQSQITGIAGGPVVVHNAGVGGFGPDQYLLQARSLLAKDEYELVIASIYLGNDVIARDRGPLAPRPVSQRGRFRVPVDFSKRAFIDAILVPTNDFLEERSHLYLFIRTRLQTLRMRMGLAPVDFPSHYLKSVDNEIRWEVTANLLEAIDRVATAHGANAIFVLVPAPFQVDPADLMRYVRAFRLKEEDIDLDLPNRRLQAELEVRGITTIDLLPAFRTAHESGVLIYGSVDQHLSPSGHELFARIVAPIAAKRLQSQR